MSAIEANLDVTAAVFNLVQPGAWMVAAPALALFRQKAEQRNRNQQQRNRDND